MKIKIFIITLLVILLIPATLYAEPTDEDIGELQSQISQLKHTFDIVFCRLDVLLEMILDTENSDPIILPEKSDTIINEITEVTETKIINPVIVEYAQSTDGPWTKESYPESRYRRTGYTYNGITTYVVEEISYCWNDEHTMMFIAK
jgi:hypothetical protein